MSASWVLALVLAGAPRVTAADDARVDPSAVAKGVEARVGEAAEPWTVTLTAAPHGVRFEAKAPGRGLVAQTVELPEGSPQERAIPVASAVALAIEQASVQKTSNATTPGAGEPVSAAQPWMLFAGADAALGVGTPLDPSGGVEVGGGRWLGPDRVFRLSVSLGWAHARRQGLVVHAVQPAVQFDAGAAVGKRWWVGGGARVGATTAWAIDRDRARGSAVYGRVPVTVEVQLGGRWFARGMLGVDLRTPSLRFRGVSSVLRWGFVRPVGGLALGVSLP